MPCRLPYIFLAVVLIAPAPVLAQDITAVTVSTTELKSDSLAPLDIEPAGIDPLTEHSPAVLVSALLGQTLYASDGKRIGEISDFVMTQDFDGMLAVVGVGGVLGFGTRDVAIPKDRIALVETSSGEMKLTAASTREQLQQAPVFDRTVLMR